MEDRAGQQVPPERIRHVARASFVPARHQPSKRARGSERSDDGGQIGEPDARTRALDLGEHDPPTRRCKPVRAAAGPP